MEIIRILPNILSVSRIFAALFLLIPGNRCQFTLCYLLCGVTDVLDGYIARRFRLQTRLGAKLDSLGDFIFWLIVIPLLYKRTKIFTVPVLICIGIVFLVRLANFVVTKRKFNQWGMLHTSGNKLAGLALYIVCLIAFLYGTLAWYLWAAVFCLAIVSAAEEMAILLRSARYNPDCKGLWVETD